SRGGKRVATAYGLTWLPLHDGTAATNRWRAYRTPALRPIPVRKIRNLPTEGKVGLLTEGKVDASNLPTEGKVDTPQNLPTEGKVLYRTSYQGGWDSSGLSAGATAAATDDGGHGVAAPEAPAANGQLPWHEPTYEIVELRPTGGQPAAMKRRR